MALHEQRIGRPGPAHIRSQTEPRLHTHVGRRRPPISDLRRTCPSHSPGLCLGTGRGPTSDTAHGRHRFSRLASSERVAGGVRDARVRRPAERGSRLPLPDETNGLRHAALPTTHCSLGRTAAAPAHITASWRSLACGRGRGLRGRPPAPACRARNGSFPWRRRSRPVAPDGVDRRRAEREDAQVFLRGAEPEQRAPGVDERGHAVAGALLGIRRQSADDRPDAFQRDLLRRRQAIEVVVHCRHAPGSSRIVPSASRRVAAVAL